MPTSVDTLEKTLTWYSPFPNIEIGTEKDKAALQDIDVEISYLESIVST
jgi:hypothetical protein